jgi:N utilization substance protein B
MTPRSRARQVALQILYQDDLNPSDDETTASLPGDFLAQRLHTDQQMDFAESLILGVRQHRDTLDGILEQAATNWSLARMAATDRNVLRIGAFEILFADTPVRVAIDEAVELAKRFGSVQSAPFVNGLLDKLVERDENDGSPAAFGKSPPRV